MKPTQRRDWPVWRIEKLSRGFAFGTTPGNYLNSLIWRECGSFRAPDYETALTEAKFKAGSPQVRVFKDEMGQML